MKDFRWLDDDEVKNFDVARMVSETADTGYILEVDLEYPEHLHDHHCSFPLAPVTKNILEKDLSPYSKMCRREIWERDQASEGANAKYKEHDAEKLTATLEERKNYLVHGLNLKFYLEQGLVLKKIHRIIAFTQVDFIKPYIDYCTMRRKMATTETEKTYWKLIVNSLYGKLIEGQANRMDVKFNFSKEKATKASSSPLYKGTMVLPGEDMSNFSMTFWNKRALYMNKQQWAIGFTVLELSKLVMQRLFYEKIQPTFGPDNVELLMTDTDSFLFRIKSHQPITEDECVSQLSEVMDFSNYPKDHPLYDPSRAKQLGLIKNEMPNKKIVSFVGLKSKTYATRVEGGTEDIKAKGVPKSTHRKIPLTSMLECLKKIHKHSVTFRSLRSKKHELALIESSRVAFSSFDDKR